MRREFLKYSAAGLLLATSVGAWAASRPFDLPPSADLSYNLSARQRGFELNGDAVIVWRAGDGKYSVKAESRVPLFGKITENRSQGALDGTGLAPLEFYEKRFRKDPTTTTFDRESKTIRFSEGKQTEPLKGGDQDRASVTWQLAAVARAAPQDVKVGKAWKFHVAGRRDADFWTFRVVKREKIRTGAGEVEAVHIMREPPADAKDQALDLWLAPALEWYPVKLRFTDDEKDFVEQTLSKITPK